MPFKFISAEEAASMIHHGDAVGFSGFTLQGLLKLLHGR
jgi:acyl-CoA hydrolase